MGCGCRCDGHEPSGARQINETVREHGAVIVVETTLNYHMTRRVDQIDAVSPTTTTVTLFGDAPIGTQVIVDAVGSFTNVSGGELAIVDQDPTTKLVGIPKGTKRVFNLASTGPSTPPVWF